MPGFNPFRYRFPYTNINDINLDWIIKKVRKLSEDVAEIDPERIEEAAQQAAAAEQTAQAAGTAAAAAQTTADAAGTAAAAAQTTADAAGTAATAAQTTANQNRIALGIVANGNTAPQSISRGQYVIWKGALYIASDAIASGSTLSSSNLTAVTGGGLNSVDFRQVKRLYSSTNDLDDLHGTGASGLYYISNNVPNSPINYAIMLVMSLEGNGYATQFVLGASAYYREYAGSPPAWRSWKRLDNV